MAKFNALITGGAGFIGSHLAERLIREDFKVTVLDNLVTGRLDNLKNIEKHPNFSFIKADISELKGIISYFKGVDYVFHLAALAEVVPSIVEPHKYHLQEYYQIKNRREARGRPPKEGN